MAKKWIADLYGDEIIVVCVNWKADEFYTRRQIVVDDGSDDAKMAIRICKRKIGCLNGTACISMLADTRNGAIENLAQPFRRRLRDCKQSVIAAQEFVDLILGAKHDSTN